MPRNSLNDYQKAIVKEHADLGGVTLALMLNVPKAAIYQYATNEGFSVKKGGKNAQPMTRLERRINKMVRGCSTWPKQYKRYKKMLVQRDGLRCHYCDYLMSYEEAEVDHILAKARGGTDAPHNLVLACSRCNNLKSTLCYECPEFRNAISC